MNELQALKRQGAERMRGQGTRLRLIVAALLLAGSAMLPYLLAFHLSAWLFGSAETGLPLLEDLLFYGVWILLTAVLTLPSVALFYQYGLWVFLRAERGFGPLLPERLPDYGRLLGVGAAIVLPFLPVPLLFVIAYALAGLSEFLLYLPLMALALGLSMLYLFLRRRLLLMPYYLCLGCGISEAARLSVRRTAGASRLYGAYLLTFTGWILLSLLTVGVLLFFYTIPLMLFTYYIIAQRLANQTTQEEITHE